jgi:ketosteroid isomerase-like protein
MTTATIPRDLADRLATQLRAMTSALQRGDGLSVALVYADDALLTDLRGFRVQGRAALDAHWTSLPPCTSWQLDVLEIGGDPSLPYQRLRSTLILERNGRAIHDVGTCFVIWKRQADGAYRIYVDIYQPAT